MIKNLFKDYQRIDGRDIREYRNISIRFPKNSNDSKATSSCLVTFGKTSVLSRISCDVVEPKSNHPSRGLIQLNIDTSFIKSNSNKLREATDRALKLEPDIKDCLRDSIDLDSLCICAGERVFSINIDIKVQCDDGNLLDAIVFSALIGLKTFKRPDVTIGESGKIEVHENILEKDPVRLQMKQIPIFVSLGVVVESNLIIVDMNKSEEDALDSKLVFGMTPADELAYMYPLGSDLWTNEHFIDCCSELVRTKVLGLKHLISQAVQAKESSEESIVINSTSFLATHPVFVDSSLDNDLEPDKLINEAPEVLYASDDMEIDSDNNEVENATSLAQNDDWSRIDSLMTFTQTLSS